MRKYVYGWKKRAKYKKAKRIISAQLDKIMSNGFGVIETRQIMDNWIENIKREYNLKYEDMIIDYKKGTVDIFIKPVQAVDFINLNVTIKI